jgi:S1-C subfamily serine protease
MGMGTLFRLGLLACLLVIARAPEAAAEFNVEKVENSTVRIYNISSAGKLTGWGTGFIVNSEGYVVTNYHVIEGGSGDTLVFIPGMKGPDNSGGFMGTVRSASSEKDIAIVQIKRDALDPPDLAFPPVQLSTNVPRKGQEVYALGFPGIADRLPAEDQLWDATLTSGIVSRVSEAAWKKGDPVLKIIQHNADVNKGNSGGPLFDKCERVIAINTQISLGQVHGDVVVGAAGVNWSSSVNEATPMLQSLGVALDLSPQTCNADGELVDPDTGTVDDGEGDDADSSSAFKLSDLPTTTSLLIGGGVFALLAGLAAILILRANRPQNPPALPENHRPKPVPQTTPSNQRPAVAPPEAAAAQHDLRLSGFDGDGHPFQLSADRHGLADPYGMVLGRSGVFSELALDHPELSRRHVRFFWVAGKFFVEDLNSTNGTRVNGHALKPFDPKEVRPGQEIRLGKLDISISKG